MKNENKIFLAGFLIAAFLSMAFYQFVYTGQRDELLRREEKINVVLQKADELEKLSRLHPNTGEYLNILEKRRDIQRKLLPDTLSSGEFLSEIYSAARQAKLKIVGVEPQTPATADGYAVQKTRISFRGGYFEILDFIYFLENSGRFISMRDVKLRYENDIIIGSADIFIFARKL